MIKRKSTLEMLRGADRVYRLDHAVTKTQRTILNALGMNVQYIKDRANRISEQLKIANSTKER